MVWPPAERPRLGRWFAPEKLEKNNPPAKRAGQKAPPAGSVPTRLASLKQGWLDGQPLSLLRRQLPLHRGAFGHGCVLPL